LRLVKHAGDRIREIEALIADFHWSTVPSFTMPASQVGSEKVTVTHATNPLFTQWDRTHEVAFRVGEVVNALRSALDYSVFVLAWKDSGAEQRFTQFPSCLRATPSAIERSKGGCEACLLPTSLRSKQYSHTTM